MTTDAAWRAGMARPMIRPAATIPSGRRNPATAAAVMSTTRIGVTGSTS
jgi:hypothetical protein